MRHLHIFLKKYHAKSKYKLLAQITLISFIISSTLSCTSAPPTRVAITNDQLSNCNAVALHVSSSKLDVKYSREGGMYSGTAALGVASALLVSLLGMATAFTADALIKSSKDSKSTEGVRKAFDDNYFERLLGDYFIENIRKANSFKINYSEHTNYKALSDKGYNAIIELNIDELSLKRAGVTDKLNIYIHVLGKMVDLQNESAIWSQHEAFMSDEEYTLDEYKENEGKILREAIDKALKKIAFSLACNIIYSK